MEPNMWGPIYWSFLFSTVLGYPLEPGIDIQSAYYRFFRLLEQVLPCGVCKANYAEHFRNIPLNFYLYSRKALMEWVLILYNEVNRSLGKPPLTLEQAIQKYLGPKFIDCTPYKECINMPSRSQVGGNDVFQAWKQTNGEVGTKTQVQPNKAIAQTSTTVPANTGPQQINKTKERTVTVEGFSVNNSSNGWNWNIIMIVLACVALLYLLYRKK